VADILAGELDSEVAENQGDIWSFVGVEPESGFVHTVHTGVRDLENATIFIEEIKKKSDGCAPLFHSDGWFYSQALTDTYSTFVPVPYAGKGRPALPKKIVDPALKYVQVCKKRDDKGKIEAVTTKIVLGDEIEVLQVLEEAKRCKTINTDYVESRNGKYRKDNARLIRKTLCHSKKAVFHKAHILFLTCVFNFTRYVDTLKQLVQSTAKKFETKYKHRTPAMAVGIIDKLLTLKEILTRRVPIRLA
jgi:hypothetical protein